MTQPASSSSLTQTPPARAGRLAARLQGRCLRTGGVDTALHEIGLLDSGALSALPQLSGDLLRFQEAEPLPADPLRQLLLPPRRPRLPWPTPGKRSGDRPEIRLPELSSAEWQTWQDEVQQTGTRLTHQWEALAELQARQSQLLADLRADSETLTLAGQALLTAPELPEGWRRDLAAALQARVSDVQVALTVAGQLGEATALLIRNHQVLYARLRAAAQLQLYAAQTGLSLQQALRDQARLGVLAGPDALPDLPVQLPPDPRPDRQE